MENNKRFLIDVTSLLAWGRPPVGIIRTLFEVVVYSLKNDINVVYFRFSDDRTSIIEVSPDIVQQHIDYLNNLEFVKPKQSSKHTTAPKTSIINKVINYKNTYGTKALIILVVKKYCPAGLQPVLKKIYSKYFAKITSVAKEKDQLSAFVPEIEAAENFKQDIFDSNSIVISIGLDWDKSNYQLLYWLKKRFNFKFVSAFYDAIPVTHHEMVQSFYFSQMFFLHIYNLIYLSDRIFCISDYSRKELIKICERHMFSTNPDMRTIYLGANVECTTRKTSTSISRPHKDNYVIYVSTVESRKNHSLLIDVWKKLIREQNVNDIPDLVCVGMHGWGVEKMYESYAQDKQLQKHMFFYTDVSDSELNELYSKCTFTLFPSHVEGWGLGAVESLLYKKVSVISTCEALSEATQGLMPSIDPYDTDAWAEMVMKLSLDKVFRNELEQKISDEFKIRHWNEFCRDFFSYAGGDE